MDTYNVEKGESPPKYEESTLPTYESIMKKVQQAQEESSGKGEFAEKMVAIACCGTVCTVISLLLSFSIPIANVVIGAIYMNDCKAEKYIPIFLLVGGAFGIFKGTLQLGVTIRKKIRKDEPVEGEEHKQNRPNPLEGLVSCFLFAWLIAGSVWVYSIYGDVKFNDKDSNDYCHEVCYKYAFWFITATYILMGLGLLCCCTCVVFISCVACKKKDNTVS